MIYPGKSFYQPGSFWLFQDAEMAQPGYGEGLLILWSYDLGSSNLPLRAQTLLFNEFVHLLVGTYAGAYPFTYA